MVTGAADQVKEQMTQTKEQIKQTFDWRHQVEERPLVALGAAFIGGIVLGGITGGDGGQQHHYRPQAQGNGSLHAANYGQSTSYGEAAAGGGLMAAVRAAARKTGLEETVGNMADGLMATLTDRVKQIADDAFPDLADKLQTSSSSSSSAAQPGPSGMAQTGYGQSGAYGATHATTGGASYS